VSRGPSLCGSVLGLVVAAALGVTTLAGCGTPATTPVVLPPGSLGPPVTLAPTAAPLVRIDPSLLAVLPDSLDGLSVLESSEADADAQSNASLALIADAAVGALAIDPGSGDFVLSLVVRLKPGTVDEAGFRNWRDSYDAGACSNAVSGHAEAAIAGRTVYVGTCANGLHTYHLWIADRNLLVSASSGGARGLGEALFAELRPDAG
jgi:hypothetical protein